MSTQTHIALLAEQTLEASIPQWIHILPVGDVQTVDARGPYRALNLSAIIAASFDAQPRIPIDENHSLHLAAGKGQPSPARGWIVEMDARADGIWGRVEWSKTGREMMAERQYRSVSPVIQHTDKKEIIAIEAVSLVNRPNLRGLTALNMEHPTMTFMERLIEALGLTPDATEEDVIKAIAATKKDDEVAMQSALVTVGTALGAAGTSPDDLVNTARALNAANVELTQTVTALQSENKALKSTATRKAAEDAVDAAIRAKRVGVKASRDAYISMHMENADRTQAILNGLPSLDDTQTTNTPPSGDVTQTALNSEQMKVADLLGIPHDAYAKTLAAEKD